MNQNDLLTQLQMDMAQFSKGQRLIAQYMLAHYEKAAYMTASRLGAFVGVSESTVVRFATELGFDGYPSLQKALQDVARNKLTTVQRMDVTTDRMQNRDVLDMVLSSDVEKIRQTLEELERETFHGAVQSILQAKTIYILGVRSSSALANFLGFYLKLLFANVVLVDTAGVSEVFEQIFRIGQEDVLIGIGFPRYSKRTLTAMKYAKDRKASVVALTDSALSPLASLATHTLVAKSDMASFVDSLVAPLSVINALIVAVGMEKTEEIKETFHDLEKIWAEYQVYET